MVKALLLSAILLGWGGQAIADDLEFQFGDGPPIRFHHARPTIIVRQGTKIIPIQDGLTPLDKGHSPIKCVSAAGCLVTAKIWVVFDGLEDAPTISAYVDGVAIQPNSAPLFNNDLTAQQSALVSQGSHTVQSQVSQQVTHGNVTGWNAEYAVYELK